MNVEQNINRKFKAIVQDITGEVHHIEIFSTLTAAKNFVRRKIEETSGALQGEVQEIATEVHKVEEKAKEPLVRATVEGEKILTKAEKEVDKAK